MVGLSAVQPLEDPMTRLGSLPSALLLHLRLASPSAPAGQPATPQLHSLCMRSDVMFHSRRCRVQGCLRGPVDHVLCL